MPTVSIGMPVYNGEPYLSAAIESVLAQTFSDFELVISDNASNDQTEAICRRYAAQDQRVRYLRYDSNRGAAWNFRNVFEQSSGCFFKWAAADDLLSPNLIEACVSALDDAPDAVLAHPATHIIDQDGELLMPYDSKLRSDSTDSVTRFFDLLRGHKCFEIFGLIRRDALALTDVMGDYGHSDGVVLAHLALLGRFVAAPEATFYPRRHGQQSMESYGVYADGSIDYHSYTVWFAPHKAGQRLMPYWKIAAEFMRSVGRAPLTVQQRLWCSYRVARWCGNHRRQLWGDVRRRLGDFGRMNAAASASLTLSLDPSSVKPDAERLKAHSTQSVGTRNL